MINQHEQPAQPLVLTQPVRRPARVAFQWGLIFGGAWATFTLLDYLFRQFLLIKLILLLHISFSILSTSLSYFSTLIFILIFFGSGVLASKRTGQVTTAIFTILWVFLWGFVAGILTEIISYILIFPHFPSSIIEDLLHSIFLALTVSSMVSLVVGAILGALGGVLGRWLWRRQQREGKGRSEPFRPSSQLS